MRDSIILIDMNGDVSHATLHYIVRDMIRDCLGAKKQTLRFDREKYE